MIAFRQLEGGAVHVMWKLNTQKHWYKGKWYDHAIDYPELRVPKPMLDSRLEAIENELI